MKKFFFNMSIVELTGFYCFDQERYTSQKAAEACGNGCGYNIRMKNGIKNCALPRASQMQK
jgi:hypothetical protein